MDLVGTAAYYASRVWDARGRLWRERPAYVVVALALFVGAASGRVLIELIEQLLFKQELGTVDRWVFQALQAVRTEPVEAFFAATTHLGDTWMLIGVVAVGVAALLVMRRRAEAAVITAVFVLAATSVALMKVMLQRARPDDALHLVPASGAAFPSGHASLSFVAYLLLAYLVVRQLNSMRGYVIFGAAVILSLVIGLSRLVLGVHWLSDVLAGYALAGLWVSVGITMIEFIRHFQPAPVLDSGRRRLAGWTIGTLVLLIFGFATYQVLR